MFVNLTFPWTLQKSVEQDISQHCCHTRSLGTQSPLHQLVIGKALRMPLYLGTLFCSHHTRCLVQQTLASTCLI